MEFKKAGEAFYCCAGRILKITYSCPLCKYYSLCGDFTSLFIKHSITVKVFSHKTLTIPKTQRKLEL